MGGFVTVGVWVAVTVSRVGSRSHCRSMSYGWSNSRSASCRGRIGCSRRNCWSWCGGGCISRCRSVRRRIRHCGSLGRRRCPGGSRGHCRSMSYGWSNSRSASCRGSIGCSRRNGGSGRNGWGIRRRWGLRGSMSRSGSWRNRRRRRCCGCGRISGSRRWSGGRTQVSGQPDHNTRVESITSEFHIIVDTPSGCPATVFTISNGVARPGIFIGPEAHKISRLRAKIGVAGSGEDIDPNLIRRWWC